jgi:hypothetical protein
LVSWQIAAGSQQQIIAILGANFVAYSFGNVSMMCTHSKNMSMKMVFIDMFVPQVDAMDRSLRE